MDADVEIGVGDVRLPGHLAVPRDAAEVVVFAHGSGSSRNSPRNQYVASVLNRSGLGTLLFDLLTPGEEADLGNVFDLALLAECLAGATAWLRAQPGAAGLPVGYFGASTGAAAVSRGGRPDVAGARLGMVRAPTLLIGVEDDETAPAEPARPDRAAMRERDCRGALGHAPVHGAGHPCHSSRAGPRLVHRPPQSRLAPPNGPGYGPSGDTSSAESGCRGRMTAGVTKDPILAPPAEAACRS